MQTELEYRLSQFVDRENEMKMFCQMLDTFEKPIMVVSGDSGIGKSSLLARMIHETASRNLRKSEIDFGPARNRNYMSIMRKMRDDVGPGKFNAFTDLVNYFTKPNYELSIKIEGNIEVANEAIIKNSQVDTIAGVVIKDLHLTAPRNDQAVPEEERITRLTEQFIHDLSGVLEKEPLVVFFDAVEKMTMETQEWVCNDLFGALRDGRLKNIWFVLSGQCKPEMIDEWYWMYEEAALGPLKREHIIQYLEKMDVNVGDSSMDDFADLLMSMTKGNAVELAKAVEAFMRYKQKRADA